MASGADGPAEKIADNYGFFVIAGIPPQGGASCSESVLLAYYRTEFHLPVVHSCSSFCGVSDVHRLTLPITIAPVVLSLNLQV